MANLENEILKENESTVCAPPTTLKREITGEYQQQENIHFIEMFGLTAFIEENQSMFRMEINAPLHVYLNNPYYIRAQQLYLHNTRRT